MDEQEALNIARQLLLHNNIRGGTPSRKTYHSEGGQSLDSIERMKNYESLLHVPYWEIVFHANDIQQTITGRDDELFGFHAFGESNEIVVIVFDNQRAFLQTSSLSFN